MTRLSTDRLDRIHVMSTRGTNNIHLKQILYTRVSTVAEMQVLGYGSVPQHPDYPHIWPLLTFGQSLVPLAHTERWEAGYDESALYEGRWLLSKLWGCQLGFELCHISEGKSILQPFSDSVITQLMGY